MLTGAPAAPLDAKDGRASAETTSAALKLSPANAATKPMVAALGAVASTGTWLLTSISEVARLSPQRQSSNVPQMISTVSSEITSNSSQGCPADCWLLPLLQHCHQGLLPALSDSCGRPSPSPPRVRDSRGTPMADGDPDLDEDEDEAPPEEAEAATSAAAADAAAAAALNPAPLCRGWAEAALPQRATWCSSSRTRALSLLSLSLVLSSSLVSPTQVSSAW
mmetsp:Transcript_2779/g.6509  ORF Transcript_2779/g.6509 Transcript_2779/m.6509 type:complete len:222 (+) Transcript_2779:584-1249(+)